MKKIALIMDGWKRFFTYAWPAGVLERIRETNEDVNLYIFNSSGDWSRDEDYNIGEYNIYRLPDLNDFDGIIVDLNNIRYSEVLEYVISSAKATGKPVISIANEIADFYYVGIDNYSAMQEIAAHLYEVHNCRRFWYVMGPDDNYESNRRVAALRDFSETHGILWDARDLYCESYEYKWIMTGRTNLRRTGSDHNMPAVPALPHFHTAFLKHRLCLHISQELPVPLFMHFLNRANHAKSRCKRRKAFLLRRFCKILIHVCPLIVLPVGCGIQILSRIADQSQFLAPHLRMCALVIRRLLKNRGNLLIAFLFCDLRKKSIAVSRL